MLGYGSCIIRVLKRIQVYNLKQIQMIGFNIWDTARNEYYAKRELLMINKTVKLQRIEFVFKKSNVILQTFDFI